MTSPDERPARQEVDMLKRTLSNKRNKDPKPKSEQSIQKPGKKKPSRMALPVFAFALLACGTAHADICRVTTAGTETGTGSDWAAPMDLHTALADTGCTEIWVAAGVYKPVEPDDPDNVTQSEREISFVIDRQVEIFGGFEGNENHRDERDWTTHLTVLSGDIDNNDTTNDDGITEHYDHVVGDNSLHVVWIDGGTTAITNTTVIDGFVITAGRASVNTFPSNSGAGLFCDGENSECSPVVSNTVFTGNRAHFGGAMYNGGLSGISDPTLIDVTFSANFAVSEGGAMYNRGGSGGQSSPELFSVTFSGNSARSGGAMYNYGRDGISSPILAYVDFSGNAAAQYGGAMYNRAWDGTSSPVLTNVDFSGNSAGSDGGAMFNIGSDGTSNPTLEQVTFNGNSATGSGGAMYNFARDNGDSNSRLTNVTFSGNSAGSSGGAMALDAIRDGRSLPRLTNVSFSGNSAGSGGAIYTNNLNGGFAGGSTRNSVLWGNSPDSLSIHSTGVPIRFSHSLVEGCNPGGIWSSDCGTDGGNNLNDTDPLFIDPDSNLRLQAGSPAIDAGNNDYVADVDFDLDGHPRIMGGTVDLGAYESVNSSCPADGVLYVNQQATQASDGLSWDSAFRDLWSALQLGEACEIWIAAGVYKPADSPYVLPTDRGASFTVTHDGTRLYGGFAGHETLLPQRDPAANLTILSGDIDNNDDTDINGVVLAADDIVGDNSYHVLWTDGITDGPITDDTVIDGFVITGGLADVSNGFPHNSGGGLFCDGSGNGNECSPIVSHVRFSGNAAVWDGGAMYNHGRYDGKSSPVLTNVSFSGNAAGWGGAVYNDGRDNGVSSPVLTSISLGGNSASFDGGAMVNNGLDGLSAPQVRNSILWNNGLDAVFNNSATPGYSHSLVEGLNPAGGGNLDGTDPDNNPLFIDPAGDLRLQPGSPAIDAGNNAYVDGVGFDLAGNPRIFGETVDLGAYETIYYTVTPEVFSGGAIDPDQPRIALQGEQLSFTVTPDTGYSIDTIEGCDGTLADAVFTTAPITGDCTVTASFQINSYTVGGMVSGLKGSGLVLQNNGDDDLHITENGSFNFSTPLADLSSYEVSVLTHPDNPAQTCTVANGSGTLAGADVDDIDVRCTTDTILELIFEDRFEIE